MRIHADGVLFDNDGVLVDSEAAVERAWRQLAVEFDLDVEAIAAQHQGVRAIETLARHLDGDDLITAVERLEQIEIDLAADARPLPGAIELCASLPVGSWTIATSASRRLARVRWASAGIPEPATTVTADEVSSGKPHPEPYLRAAALLGVEPSRCVVFEDSPTGASSARSAGATPIAVGAATWSFEPAGRVDDLRAITVVESSTHRFALMIERRRA